MQNPHIIPRVHPTLFLLTGDFFLPDFTFKERLEPSVKNYKRKYDRELKHVKIILSQERRRMPVNEWLQFVQKTKDCILSAPDSFFGNELPVQSVLSEAIDKVFECFLEDQRLLANQTPKRFKIPLILKSKQ